MSNSATVDKYQIKVRGTRLIFVTSAIIYFFSNARGRSQNILINGKSSCLLII